MIPILPPTEENLRRAAEALGRGELVSFPTETVYGLGGHAMNALALARIFEVKRRPFFDPLIVHVANRQGLAALCLPADARAELLMETFWPGPLTLVLPKTAGVPELATSGLPTVAVRIPSHPIALQLLRLAGIPIAAPSANPFGRLSPTTAEHVQSQFETGIDCILDGGPCAVGVESTILSLAGPTPVLLRAGGIPKEEIEALIGPIQMGAPVSERPQAPGQLAGHYAPRTRLIFQSDATQPETRNAVTRPGGTRGGEMNTGAARPRRGLLAFRSPQSGDYAAVEILSPAGNLQEAAANLFACLHRLDRAGLDWIEVETLPQTGLGAAILDRLSKASAGSGAD